MKKKQVKQAKPAEHPEPKTEAGLRAHVMNLVAAEVSEWETDCQKLLALSNKITETTELLIAMRYIGNKKLSHGLNIKREALCEAMQIFCRKRQKS